MEVECCCLGCRDTLMYLIIGDPARKLVRSYPLLYLSFYLCGNTVELGGTEGYLKLFSGAARFVSCCFGLSGAGFRILFEEVYEVT